MKEHPILFSGKMVRAILDDRKTRTRRVIKPQPKIIHALYSDASIATERIFRRAHQRIHCPYGQPGDHLWVRETWRQAYNKTAYSNGIVYLADKPLALAKAQEGGK